MNKNIAANESSKKHIETVFEKCKDYPNRKLKNGGMTIRFPTYKDTRLVTWVKHTGNELFLNWSSTALRQAKLCGDHFNHDDHLHNTDARKLTPGAIPQVFEISDLGRTIEITWDHTYCKQFYEKEGNQNNCVNKSNSSSRTHQDECLKKSKNESSNTIESFDDRPPWILNPKFIRTYSRKLTFKNSDDSMEWTAIEPGCPKDNVGELRSGEVLKQRVASIETAKVNEMSEGCDNKEIRELRKMNMELKYQNKLLRIENFKLQMKLARTTKNKSER